MGRATRWLRGLLGGKKDTMEEKNHFFTGSGGFEEKLQKKRWSFGKSGRNPGEGAPRIKATTPEEAAWLRSLYTESEMEQSRRAIAVAAATAAAADAAVAAAQAAVAVVRLTSKGRGAMFGIQERLAAVRIQTVFRGYLAKKALRALKALVKLQAMVRGYIVRKQATATFHSMQSLITAQATIRAQRSRTLLAGGGRRHCLQFRPRRSLERFDDSGSEYTSSIHSRRLSASLESSSFDRSPKIVEIDTCRPKSRSSRRTTSTSAADTAEEDLPPLFVSSPLPARVLKIPYSRNFHEYDWCITSNDVNRRPSSTAQNTPRYLRCSDGPPTPAKSVSAAEGRAFRRFSPSPTPSYMASTQSFEAKVRSQSAPKQRPESPTARKRVPLSEVMVESRASVGMERSEAFSFKSAVVSRIDRSPVMDPCNGDDVL